MFNRQSLLIVELLAGTATPAVARERLIFDPDNLQFLSDDDQSAADPNANFVLRGSIGVASITANEHVYNDPSSTDNLSLLVWQSTAPIANVDVKLRFQDAWTLRGRVDAALMGDSMMTDYDWIPPYNTGYGMNDWSHRSISPDTSLDWYLNGSLALGRDLPINGALTVNVNGGFQYTDVEWTATGGTFIYSDGGYRNDIGTIPDVAAVRYRQQLPTVFAGIDATVNDGPWNLEVDSKAGLLVGASSTDHHYLRIPPFYIVDDLTYGQLLSVDAKLGYDISDHLGAYFDASYEKVFSAHTPTTYSYISNNQSYLQSDWRGGAELDVASITAGLKGNF